MAQLLYPLALLACPVGMGLMMWFMMRSGKSDTTGQTSSASGSDEMVRLRAEVDQLRAAQRSDEQTYPRGSGSADRR